LISVRRTILRAAFLADEVLAIGTPVTCRFARGRSTSGGGFAH
jgi:hypothetical protein